MSKITQEQYDRIARLLPVQRGNVTHSNINVLNGILYVMVNGCPWRSMPTEFGCWHTVYQRMNRWSEEGVLDKIFTALQKEGILGVDLRVLSMDSTSIKVHPDGCGARKKTGRRPSESAGAGGTPNFIWLPRMIGR